MGEQGMVQARLELCLDGLRATCAEYLLMRQGQIQAMVDRQLDAQMASGHIERMIAVQIEREVRDHLDRSIKSAVSAAFYDGTAKNTITKAIVDGIAQWGAE